MQAVRQTMVMRAAGSIGTTNSKGKNNFNL